MSLTVYQSKFVLVGGRYPFTREPTNIVLTSTTGQQWDPQLPPMPTKRYCTSSVSTRSPEVLVVAGGRSPRKDLDVVEVLTDDKWSTADPLPAPDYAMHSTFHDENLYFIGGVYQYGILYTCSCASLISSCEKSSSHISNRQLWWKLEVEDHRTVAISCASRLVNINCWGRVECYSSTHHSWIEANSTGDEVQHHSLFIAASVLPTGDIVYAHDEGIYRMTVAGEYVCVYM